MRVHVHVHVCVCMCMCVCVCVMCVCVCRLAWKLSLIICRNKVCEMLVWEEGNRNAFLISRVLPMDWKIAPGIS